MTGFRSFSVPEDVVAQARVLGVLGDTRARVEAMARQAAPFSHPQGNRRFEDYLLRVTEGRVIGIIRLHGAVRPITEGGAEAADLPSPVFRNAINCTKCSGRMRRVMLDRCKVCHGSGRVPLYTAKGKLITECSTCSGRGELRVVRACPAVSEPGTICG